MTFSFSTSSELIKDTGAKRSGLRCIGRECPSKSLVGFQQETWLPLTVALLSSTEEPYYPLATWSNVVAPVCPSMPLRVL
jgi:hypothetical protein